MCADRKYTTQFYYTFMVISLFLCPFTDLFLTSLCYIYLFIYFFLISLFVCSLYSLIHLMYCLINEVPSSTLSPFLEIQTPNLEPLDNHLCDRCETIRRRHPVRRAKTFSRRASERERGSRTDRQTRQTDSYQIHFSCDLNVSFFTLCPSCSRLYALLHQCVLLQFSRRGPVTCKMDPVHTGYREEKSQSAEGEHSHQSRGENGVNKKHIMHV